MEYSELLLFRLINMYKRRQYRPPKLTHLETRQLTKYFPPTGILRNQVKHFRRLHYLRKRETK